MEADTDKVPSKDASIPGMAKPVTGGLAATIGQARVENTVEHMTSTGAAAEVEMIPVLREEVRISKREVETGRVVIHKTVTERDENVEMLLRQTDVSVERIAIGRTVTEAPSSRQEGDVLIIPVLEEVLVVEKRIVLREELHIRKTTSERAAHEVVRLRTENVQIEPTGNVAVPSHTHPNQEN